MANSRKNTNVKNNKTISKKQQPRVTARIDQILDGEESALRAFASVNIAGVMAVHGLRILESEKGLFVAMPSRSYTDRNGETKYPDVAHPVTAEARTAINESVLAAYNQELSENESLAEDISDQDLSFEQDI